MLEHEYFTINFFFLPFYYRREGNHFFCFEEYVFVNFFPYIFAYITNKCLQFHTFCVCQYSKYTYAIVIVKELKMYFNLLLANYWLRSTHIETYKVFGKVIVCYCFFLLLFSYDLILISKRFHQNTLHIT